MTDDTTTKTEHTVQTNLDAIQANYNEIDNQDLNNLEIFAQLTAKQRALVVALTDNLVSENIRTDKEICADVGISQQALWLNRKNPDFVKALGALVITDCRGNVDKPMATLFREAQKDPKTALDYLKVVGYYTPQSKNLNVNAHLDQRNTSQKGLTLQDTADNLLIRLGELRVDVEYVQDFAAKLPHRFLELKLEGAF